MLSRNDGAKSVQDWRDYTVTYSTPVAETELMSEAMDCDRTTLH
jgi:hypothetical protein